MKPENLERLLTVEMPFGKYQGRVIADLPGDYLNWFAREGFPKSEIGRLLALMHEIDPMHGKPRGSARGQERARRRSRVASCRLRKLPAN